MPRVDALSGSVAALTQATETPNRRAVRRGVDCNVIAFMDVFSFVLRSPQPLVVATFG